MEVILIANADSTFVRHDEEMLAEIAEVHKLITSQPKTLWAFIQEQIRIFLFIKKHIRRSKAVFCWFADYHSYFPARLARRFKVPFYLIQGGYDTTYLPEFNYGVYTNRLRQRMVDYAYRQATLNLPVSNFLAKEITVRYGNKVNVNVLPTGYRAEDYSVEKKEKLVLSVCMADSQKRFLIKGVDRFVELAKAMPDTKFLLIGVKEELLRQYGAPSNLVHRGVITQEELKAIYTRAKVYAQFSIREGLPNAVLEAMLFGCVVVGMNHSGIAEAVGDYGYLLGEWRVQEARKLVLKALQDASLGPLAKEHVRKNFNEDNRRHELHALVNS